MCVCVSVSDGMCVWWVCVCVSVSVSDGCVSGVCVFVFLCLLGVCLVGALVCLCAHLHV